MIKKIVSFGLSTLALSAVFFGFSSQAAESELIPADGNALVIKSQQQLEILAKRHSNVLKSDIIIIEDGVVVDAGDQKLTLVANTLTFNQNAAIRGRNLLIVASEISGGVIDASGASGQDAFSRTVNIGGAPAVYPGQNGGVVVVAAQKITGTQILANGGSGGNGLNGLNGAPGTNGKNGEDFWENSNLLKKMHPNYRVPGPGESGTAGQNGEPGYPAANGGRGGQLFVLNSVSVNVETSAAGGHGGVGGAGGKGGPGGKGGHGGRGGGVVRGHWPDAPGGKDGTPGQDAPNGADGLSGEQGLAAVKNNVKFETIKDIYTKHAANREALEKALSTIAASADR